MFADETPDGVPPQLHHCLPYKADVIQTSTRAMLGQYLNPEKSTFTEGGQLQDWRGVAEEFGFDSLCMDNFALNTKPFEKVYNEWAIQPTATVGGLIRALITIERYDILQEKTIINKIGKDVDLFVTKQREFEANLRAVGEPLQDDKVDSSLEMDVDEFRDITLGEVETGEPEYFDAYVCYTETDFPFVKEMMQKLENVHKLKLCIAKRDIVAGGAEYPLMAKLIKERCKKMIIILSPDYTHSKECDFQTKFAFSLAPGAKEKKLIPVIIKPCAIPTILNHICLLDFTKCDVIDWFWERLAKSLKREPVYIPRRLPLHSNGLATMSPSSALLLSTELSQVPFVPIEPTVSMDDDTSSFSTTPSRNESFTSMDTLSTPVSWTRQASGSGSFTSSTESNPSHEERACRVPGTNKIQLSTMELLDRPNTRIQETSKGPSTTGRLPIFNSIFSRKRMK